MKRIIKIADSIRDAIASAIVKEAHPAHTGGYWYVVNGAEVVYHEATAPWKPWDEGDDVINVTDLADEFGGADGGVDFWGDDGDDPEQDQELRLEFALGYIPSEYEVDDEEDTDEAG